MKRLQKYRDYILPIILALFGLIFLIHGLGWAYPKPIGYVNDFANIISEQDRIMLDKKIRSIKESTQVQIAIVTVTSLEGKDAETYTRELANAWGVGIKGKDNGLVLLIAPKEKKWFFKTGYGTEAILPDSRLGSIGRNLFVPEYRKGNVGVAFNITLDQIYSDILIYQRKEKQKENETKPTVTNDTHFSLYYGLGGGILLFIIILIYSLIRLSTIREKKRALEREALREVEKIKPLPLPIYTLPIRKKTAQTAPPPKKKATTNNRYDEESRRSRRDDDEESHRSRHDDDDYHSSSHSSDSDSSGGGFGGGGFGGGGAGGDL